MTADDGFVMHFRMRNGCVGHAAEHGVRPRHRRRDAGDGVDRHGLDRRRRRQGAGSPTRRACARCPSPTICARWRRPPLPEGSVTTTYEQMTTFGVEYGPYTRLAAAFRDRIRGRRSWRAGSRPPSSTAWPRWRCSTRLGTRRATVASGPTWSSSTRRRRTIDVECGLVAGRASDPRTDHRRGGTVSSMAVARLGGCRGGPVHRRGPPLVALCDTTARSCPAAVPPDRVGWYHGQ